MEEMNYPSDMGPPSPVHTVTSSSEHTHCANPPFSHPLPTKKGKDPFIGKLLDSGSSGTPTSANTDTTSTDSDETESERSGSGVPTGDGILDEDMFSDPETSPEPYFPLPLEDHEKDVNWEEYNHPLSKKDQEQIKKDKGKLSAVDQESTISMEDIRRTMACYHQEGKYVKPLPNMRPHRSNTGNVRVPRVVVTDKHISYGVGHYFLP